MPLVVLTTIYDSTWRGLYGGLRPRGSAPGDRGVTRGTESRTLCVGRCLYIGAIRHSQQAVEPVPFQAGDFGFTADCVAQCENILSIDRAQLHLAEGPMGPLDEVALQKVIKSIGYVIESDCKLLGSPV